MSADRGPDIVDESRMDPVEVDVAEGDAVTGVVEAVDGGELLVFPPGRFAWPRTARVTVDDWGIRCHADTVFEVPAGWGDGEEAPVLATHYDDSTADNVLLENLAFDAPGRAAPGLHLAARTRARVDGLRYEMNGPLSNRWHYNAVRAYAEEPDGIVRIDDLRQFNNGDLGGYGAGDSRTGVWVGPKNRGTVHLHNPVLQGFPNNACYVSRQPGTVVVEGGLLLNNNVSAVRVSGGVEVRDTTIYIDVDGYLNGPGVIQAPAHNTRGVWGDNRAAGTDGGLVTGVSTILKSYRRSTGLATILENPWMTVRDSQFLLDAPIAAVQADAGEIAVVDCDFASGGARATAGVGRITGSANRVAEGVDPGAVPVAARRDDFEWAATHPETPDPRRPDP